MREARKRKKKRKKKRGPEWEQRWREACWSLSDGIAKWRGWEFTLDLPKKNLGAAHVCPSVVYLTAQNRIRQGLGGGGRERNKAGGGNALVGRLAAQPMCLRSGKRKNGRSLSVRQSRTARTNTRDKDTPRKGGTKGGIVSAEVVPVQTDIHGEAHREDGQEEGGEVENEDGQGGREREGSWW